MTTIQPTSQGSTEPVRVADLMACLSVAADLGMGLPADYAMTTCVVGMRLGDALGFDTATLQDVYYETLLRYVGCNAGVQWFASLYGDELAFRAEYATFDTHDMPAILDLVHRSIRRSAFATRGLDVEQAIARALSELPTVMGSFLPGHCETARRLSQRMGFPESFVDTVGQIYARWDGLGIPPLEGEAIAPAFLCASLAHDAATHLRLGGVSAATAMARERSGGMHAPYMVEVFCAQAETILRGLERPPRWEDVLALEPGERRVLDDDRLDEALEAVADFGDLKSPWFLGHSRGVAELAVRAGEVFGLPAGDIRLLRRAALVHDIGKVGVSTEIWGNPDPLSESEWESVRLCSGMYRGLKLWEAAVKEAGTLNQEDVIRALDHAKIAEGPGGPAEMVPGQHHVRMNMYIAQANNGSFRIVKNLGVIDPKELVLEEA